MPTGRPLSPVKPGRLRHGTRRPDPHRLNVASPVSARPAGASPGALADKRTSNRAIAVAKSARQRASRRLRFEIALPRNRRAGRQLCAARRRQQVGAPSPFECEHARGLEAQHVALRVEEEIELRGQRYLLHDHAARRQLLRGGVDGPDGRCAGVKPCRRSPKPHAGGADSLERSRARRPRARRRRARSRRRNARSTPTVSKLPASGFTPVGLIVLNEGL